MKIAHGASEVDDVLDRCGIGDQVVVVEVLLLLDRGNGRVNDRSPLKAGPKRAPMLYLLFTACNLRGHELVPR